MKGTEIIKQGKQANGKITSLWVGPLADVVVPIGNIRQIFTNSVFPLNRACKLNSRPWLFQKIKYPCLPNLILLLGNAKRITRENVKEQCTQVILKTGYGKKRSVLLYWEPK